MSADRCTRKTLLETVLLHVDGQRRAPLRIEVMNFDGFSIRFIKFKGRIAVEIAKLVSLQIDV